MNKKTLLNLMCLVALCLQQKALEAQSPLADSYMQWIFGYGDSHESFIGHNIIEFNDGMVTIDTMDLSNVIDLGGTASGITDVDGKIRYLTNGCDIRDSNMEIIAGGDKINGDNQWYENYCGIGIYYPMSLGTLFLPGDSATLLFHADTDISSVSDIPNTGKVYLKTLTSSGGVDSVSTDMVLAEGDFARGIKYHYTLDDGSALWLLIREHYSNVFHSYYILRDGSYVRGESSELGDVIEFHNQAAFSADGNLLAVNTTEGLFMYDFDLETGALSNFRNYLYPDPFDSGVCFSPSGKYVYVTNYERVFQLVVDSDPDSPEYHDYGDQRTFHNNWPVAVGNMILGPDCRIYLSPSSSINMMHVIHEPDLPAEEAEYQKHIPIPMRFDIHFPQIPNLYGSCDKSIEWDIRTSVLTPVISEQVAVLHPNPSRERTQLFIPEGHGGTVTVHDLHGRIMLYEEVGAHEQQLDIKVSGWPSGTYIVVLRTDRGTVTGKLVVL